MKKHEWRENTDDGDVRLVAASRQTGEWKLRSRLKSEDEWTTLEVIPLDDLEYLREIMLNKYQRRRIPYEHIQEVDALIVEAERRR